MVMEVSHQNAWDQFLDEFTNVFSVYDLNKHKVFICGSYNEKNFLILQKVQDLVSKNPKMLAFFEKEFRRTHVENLVLKFDLIAKFSDEIIVIIEHDKGGHMIEMGIILSYQDFLKKSTVFVLKSADITHVLKKGGLLTPFFEENINLFYFETSEELFNKIKKLYEIK
jgi:hypothetical protein